jgi:hypothetical protein
MRTVLRSPETSSASAGAVIGSTTWSNVGTVAPPTVDVSAVIRATMSLTSAAIAGSSTVPVGDDTTSNSDWLGSSVPEALKTSSALIDS